jgi:preprotein translocase subunit Sss1
MIKGMAIVFLLACLTGMGRLCAVDRLFSWDGFWMVVLVTGIGWFIIGTKDD